MMLCCSYTVSGFSVGGEVGVSHVLKSLLGELDITLHLEGLESAAPEHPNHTVLERGDSL